MSVQCTYLYEYEAGENCVASKLLALVIGKHFPVGIEERIQKL